MDNLVKYYPCDICGHNSPSNVQFRKGSIDMSYCQMHYLRNVIDLEITTRRVKNMDIFRDEFRKAFVNAADKITD